MLVVVFVAARAGHPSVTSVAAGTARVWLHHLWFSMRRAL
jgi:hypothetical protein